MNILGEIIRFIQQSERLIVVSVVFLISGLVVWVGERAGLLEFAGLPGWARPTGTLVWVISSVHVLVRSLISAPAAFRAAAKLAADYQQQRRQQAADSHIIKRLLKTRGLAREILCYARFTEENLIWTDDQDHRWLNKLREAGLVALSDANFRTAYYRIHHVAWHYMTSHPDKFVHALAWRDRPWTEDLDETQVEDTIKNRVARAA